MRKIYNERVKWSFPLSGHCKFLSQNLPAPQDVSQLSACFVKSLVRSPAMACGICLASISAVSTPHGFKLARSA